MRFTGYNPRIRQTRTDNSFRIEMDVSEDQYDLIKDLPKMQEQELSVEITQKDAVSS